MKIKILLPAALLSILSVLGAIPETSAVDESSLISSIEDGKQITIFYQNESGVDASFFFKREADEIKCMAVDNSVIKTGSIASVFILTEDDVDGLNKLFSWYLNSGSNRSDIKLRNEEKISVRAKGWKYSSFHRKSDGIDLQPGVLSLRELWLRISHKKMEVSDY
jgi:hypothetical protein